jgi:hypothetical protein
MAQVCVKPVLLAMMHQELYFHRLLADQSIKVLWLVWAKKIRM